MSISRSRARARRRDRGHRLAQPEGVHGDEDRPPRRAARSAAIGPAGVRDRASAGDVAWKGRGTVRGQDVWPRSSTACSLRRLGRDQAAARRDRRRERNGRRDAPARARAAAGEPCVVLRPGRDVPNHEPNPLLPENREFIIAQDARGGRRPRRRVRRRRRPLLLRRRHGEFVPGDFITALLAEAILEKEPGAKIIYDVRRAGRPQDDQRAGGVPLVTGSATRTSSTACAQRTPSSAARSRPTTTSATSRRPTRASSRSC